MKMSQITRMVLISFFVFSIQNVDAKEKTKEDFVNNFKNRIDADGDGKCTKEEWMKFAKVKYKKDPEGSYQKAFVTWDTDKNGILTMDEYVSARLAGEEKRKAKRKNKK